MAKAFTLGGFNLPGSALMVTTKLLPPRPGFRLLDRPRLTRALAGYQNRKLTVVVAPAGFELAFLAPGENLPAGVGLTGRAVPALPKAVSPAGQADRQTRPRSGRGWRDLYTYLATEVFNDLPEEVKSFLLATSVLEVLTPVFCDTFLGRSDAQRILEFLASRCLFTTALAGEEEAYRYHHLFRKFLLNKLGNDRFLWLRRAGECCREAGLPEAAVE